MGACWQKGVKINSCREQLGSNPQTLFKGNASLQVAVSSRADGTEFIMGDPYQESAFDLSRACESRVLRPLICLTTRRAQTLQRTVRSTTDFNTDTRLVALSVSSEGFGPETFSSSTARNNFRGNLVQVNWRMILLSRGNISIKEIKAKKKRVNPFNRRIL